jgi:hypothetical protein
MLYNKPTVSATVLCAGLASKRASGRRSNEGERPDSNVCASNNNIAVFDMQAPRDVRHGSGACNQQAGAIAAVAEVEHS